MMHKCERCGYISKRAFDLLRHKSRKTPCSTRNGDEGMSQNGIIESQNGTIGSQNGTIESQNGTIESQNGIKCVNCTQLLSCYKSFKRHQPVCRQIPINVCAICKKEFASRKTRSAHMRSAKCTPPPPPPPSDATPSSSAVGPSSVTNNNNITNNNDNRQITTNTDSFNTTNNNSVNIHLNFGEEALEKLCSRPEYMDRMRELIQLGKYALPQQISDIYFNDEFPMNNTIMKQRHNDRFVKIKTGENEWNLRAIDDVYATLTNKMESYMQPYFKEVEKRMERIYDEDRVRFKQLTRSVREFGHKVLWLDWQCEDIRQIGVDLNDPYCETERKRRIQEMKSVLLEHIYDKTREHLALTNVDSEQDDV